jgi:C4-dicarboxylate transporter DctQ subunit
MKHFLSAYQNFLDGLEKATYFVVISLLGLLLLNTSLGIAFDLFIGYSLAWTEEINTLLFAWGSLLGAGAIARYGGHIGVDFLIERFSPRHQYYFRLLHTLLALIIVWVMIYFGTKLAFFVGHSQRSLYLDINLRYYYLSVPVSGIILGLNSIGAVLPDPRPT